ncbi:MAG: hypothetical protein ABR955_09420, partial [Verrucomicrobiota bacterium]
GLLLAFRLLLARKGAHKRASATRLSIVWLTCRLWPRMAISDKDKFQPVWTAAKNPGKSYTMKTAWPSNFISACQWWKRPCTVAQRPARW